MLLQRAHSVRMYSILTALTAHCIVLNMKDTTKVLLVSMFIFSLVFDVIVHTATGLQYIMYLDCLKHFVILTL